MSFGIRLIVGTVLAVVSLTAAGHADPAALHTHGQGLWSGLLHPLTGLDHLGVLVLFGVWMYRSGAGLRTAFPVMTGLASGVLLSGIGLAVGVVEAAVLVSLPLAAAAVVWARAGTSVVLLFTAIMVFHGLAHVSAVSAATPAFAFGVGFSSIAVLVIAYLAARSIGLPVRHPAQAADR